MLAEAVARFGVSVDACLEHGWHLQNLRLIAGAYNDKDLISEAHSHRHAGHGELFEALGFGYFQRQPGGGDDLVDGFLQSRGILNRHQQATFHEGFGAKIIILCGRQDIHKHVRRLGDIQPAGGGIFENRDG